MWCTVYASNAMTYHRFSLSADELLTQLPKLDVRGTAIQDECPHYAAPMTCVPGKYRRHDGLCNNLHVPTWGATLAVFAR